MRRRAAVAVALVASGALLAGFWELARVYADSEAVRAFDSAVSAAIFSLRSPVLTPLMVAITLLGGTVAVTAGVIVLIAGLSRRGRTPDSYYAVAVAAGGALLSAVGKDVFGRLRPPALEALVTLPASFSFPSGHTMGSLCLAWALGYAAVSSRSLSPARRPALVALIGLYPVLVGTSRVYLGVHWPSDVLASWLLGGAWIAAVSAVFAAVRPPLRPLGA